ncbi:MAG TPA: MFS transporter, partial [Longimicrobium sp.]|nr:MFS transporter [Longimicrobium sp.]
MMETIRVLRTFLIVWIGQIVSTVGSSLTSFVLGVWVYQQTGSATQFALIALFATLPAILLAPIAGALVDRHDRRTVMILADFGAAASTVVLALLYSAGVLQVWHIWAAASVTAVCGAFQGPAYGASLSMLVPPEHRARANGLMQTGQALAIIAPVLAAGLVATIGVGGVIAIDLATFAFAVTTLFVVRIPRPEVSAAGAAARGSLRREAMFGWEYLKARRPLLWLTLLFAFFNFFISISAVLVQPLILSFSSVGWLGWLMMAGGSGMLAGSLVMGAWGGPKRRINGVLGFVALSGLALFMHGLAPSPWLIAVMAPAFLFTIPVVGG